MPDVSNKECLKGSATSCTFKIAENAKANDAEPIYELSGFSEVNKHASLIDRISKEKGVDADLIRAIMYMETTHGYYDIFLSVVGKNKSILPMNVNVAYWGDTFGSREQLLKPYENICAGTEILKRIIGRLPYGAGVRQIATLYQNINANKVSDYGARVGKIYEKKPWKSPVVETPLTGAGSTMPPSRKP